MTQADLKEGDFVAVMPNKEKFAGELWIGQCLSEPNGDTNRSNSSKEHFQDHGSQTEDIHKQTFQYRQLLTEWSSLPHKRLTKSSVDLLKDEFNGIS